MADIEKQRIEDEKRSAEEARSTEQELQRQEELTKKKTEEEKKNRYNLLISNANQAIKNKDKSLALKKFNEVLALYPGDAIAQSGILEAEKLMDNICYQFVGTWELNEFVGSLMIRVEENGIFYHGNSNDSSTTWRCVPEKKQIIEGSFNLVYTMNESNDCLLVDFRKECFKRAGGETFIDNDDNKESSKAVSINVCSEIIGVWHWNTGAETRFYDDSKVSSSTSIRFIKSDGTWNCSDPINRTITFNTWSKERKVTMSADGNKIESIDAVLNTKITAKKISNNPFEKVTPRKTDSEIPGL